MPKFAWTGMCALLTTALLAQQPGGTVHGVVTDNSGAVIPGASVQLEGADGRKSAITQNDGSYAFAGVASGRYTVSVTFPGFVPFQHAFSVEDGRTAQMPIQLVVGAEKQSVTVQGEAGPAVSVEPDQNATAIVIKGNDLDALP